MSDPTPLPRRLKIRIGAAVVLAVLIAGGVGNWIATANKALRTPVAAYLVPLDNGGRVRFAWWRTTKLDLPSVLRSGKTAVVPPGTRVQLIHATDGRSEILTGPARVNLTQSAPNDTPHALVSPLREVLVALEAETARRKSAFAVTSPVGVTHFLNSTITWTARDGVLYDIAVVDPADPLIPPRVARALRPPVPMTELQTPLRRPLAADRNYEIVIREAGRPAFAGVAHFLAAPEAGAEATLPDTPAGLIAEAAAAMASKPTRTGDAWLALAQLPPAWARSELGVRLRLRVASELGLADEFARAKADATPFLRR